MFPPITRDLAQERATIEDVFERAQSVISEWKKEHSTWKVLFDLPSGVAPFFIITLERLDRKNLEEEDHASVLKCVERILALKPFAELRCLERPSVDHHSIQYVIRSRERIMKKDGSRRHPHKHY